MTQTYCNYWRVLVVMWLALLAQPTWAQRGRKVTTERSIKTTASIAPSTAAQWVATLRPTPAEARAKAYALYLEAVVQRIQGHEDAMYELLTRAIQLDPHLAAAYVLLAPPTQRLYPNAPERITQLLERAVALAPHTKDFLAALAEHYTAVNAYDKALPLYEQLIAFGGHTQPYLERLYSLHANNEAYDAALATLDKLERINGSSEEFMMQRIKLYRAMGDASRVEQMMDSLIASQPDRVDYLGYKALYYIETQRPKDALHTTALGLNKDSTNALLHRVRSAAYLELHDTIRANEALFDYLMLPHERVLSLIIPLLRHSIEQENEGTATVALRVLYERLPHTEDKHAMADVYTSYLEARVNDSTTLRKHLRHIVKTVPDYTQARLILLREFLRDTAFAEATTLCDEGILYTPQNPIYYYYKALFQSQIGQHLTALTTLRQGQAYLTDPKLHTSLVSNYYGIMGDLLYRQGKTKAAWIALDSALVYNGSNALVLNNYAFYLYLNQQQTEKAKQMSQKAVALEPDNLYYIDTYAKLLQRAGETAEAQILIERTLQLATPEAEGSQHIWELAGDLAYQNGQKQEALHYWHEAQRLGESSPLLQKKINKQRYFPQRKKEALSH
ncbi:MAG: hypothetical protein Q4A44_00255 [Bacteroidales bacterium]|nr:hypothetical protein [Bacteroidales bacterium]